MITILLLNDPSDQNLMRAHLERFWTPFLQKNPLFEKNFEVPNFFDFSTVNDHFLPLFYTFLHFCALKLKFPNFSRRLAKTKICIFYDLSKFIILGFLGFLSDFQRRFHFPISNSKKKKRG
jgi:hypothetical protein